MRIGAMLGNTLQSLFKRPFTENYPFDRKPAPERLRGQLVWDPEKCTGCQLCAKDCPSQAIDFIVMDKSRKQFIIRYYIDRCTYCGQCVQICRFNCLAMSNEKWELANNQKEPFTVYYGRAEDIDLYLAKPLVRSVQIFPEG